MKVGIITGFLVLFIIITSISASLMTPKLGDNKPTCVGHECHIYKNNSVSLKVLSATDIEVTVNGVAKNKLVGGMLVREGTHVEDIVNYTNQNPFILIRDIPTSQTDSDSIEYTVYAGYWNQDKGWDTASVLLEYISNIAEENLPKDFKLLQNHPNPFEKETMLNFYMPTPELITLKVYDEGGNLVVKPVCEIKYAGYNRMRIDGSGLPAGIYYYTIEASGKILTGKFLKK